VDHGFPQILGAGLATALAKGDRMRGTIVLDDDRVVHRNVGSALVKVHDGITAGFHELIYELIRSRNRALRIVHKLRLDRTPTVAEIGSHGRRERTKFKLFPALGAHREDALRTADLAFFADHSVVFGTEAFAQPLTPTFSGYKETEGGSERNGADGNNKHRDLMLIHGAS